MNRNLSKTLPLIAVFAAAASAAPISHHFTFDEADAGTGDAIDTEGGLTGVFNGAATRTAGLFATPGALLMDDTAGGLNIGPSLALDAATGLTLVATVDANWSGGSFDYDEIFRKEDGGSRILFSFQNDCCGPVLSFGLNVTGVGYEELDLPLDGVAGRPTVAEINDGTHVLAVAYDIATGIKGVWVDGDLYFSKDYADGSGFEFVNGGADGWIGSTNGAEPFTGVIDDLRIYDRALSAAEMQALVPGYGVNKPPTVSVTGPANGTSLPAPATISFTATAADPDGILGAVEFFVGSQRVAIATQPPFVVPLSVMTPGSYILTAVASDDRGARVVSAPVTLTVTGGGAPPLTVTNDLRLRLAADAGVVTTVDGAVTDWADQSPNNHVAIQVDTPQSPQLVTNAANGQPVLRFDGADDYLEIANSPELQPQSGDWTVFVVGKRNAGSQGDFPQIIGSRPWVAGLDPGWAVSFDTSGLVCSHYADGSAGHDVPGVRSSSALSADGFQVWQVEENRGAGTTAFYVGGGLDRLIATPMPAVSVEQTDAIDIGREIGGANNRRASMDLAEVLIYGRALGVVERESVTAYLSGKYALPVVQAQNPAPTVTLTSPAPAASFVVPTDITLSASAEDAGGSIASVQFYRGATLLGTVAAPPYSLNLAIANPGLVTYTAVATDNLGAVTRSAPVTATYISLSAPVPAPIDASRGLISIVDFEDSFTVGSPARTDGLYNDNATGGYEIETAHGNPAPTWMPFGNFSFNSGEGSTCCGYPGNTGNPGAATGLAQSGGGDFSIAYGLRNSYVVSVDAILPPDRLDIGSMPAAGAGLGSPGSLSVFFRKSPAQIGIYNGTTETSSGVQSGITDSNWHNYAVHFDQPNKRLGLFVDGVLLADIDLTSFGEGAYLDYSNAAVGLGGTFVFWADNFKVGGAGRLLRTIDLSDHFAVGTPARADGLYNSNATGGYNLESDPTRAWAPFNNFSFNSGEGSTCCGYPGNGGNDGAAGGIAQSGGGDFSVDYGTRSSYVVEVDAILPADRLDISSMPTAGAGLFSANSLTVFFRKDGAATGIGLFNGATETSTGATTGIADANWHRFGVHFDKSTDQLSLFVDRVLRAQLDLTTFAGGIYRNYSNAAVGMGGTFVFWADNFQVGPPEFDSTVRLTATPVGATAVALSWPLFAPTSLKLQSSKTMLVGSWSEVATPPTLHDGENRVVDPIDGTERYYRLVQP